MAVFRVEKKKGYTVMSNHHLHNKMLSFKAKGLLSFMLSLPENWNYTERGLSQFAKDGRDSIRAALSELEEQGYLERRQSRKEDGTLAEMEYVIYEQPQPREQEADKVMSEEQMQEDLAENPQVETIENTDFSPWSENPSTDKPFTENPTILNTNIQSNNKQNTVFLNNLSVKEVRDSLKQQIGYDDLIATNDKDLVDNILQVTLEMRMLAETMDTVRVGQELYPSDLIQMKLSQLTYCHIEYITGCMKNHTDRIRNIKVYLQKSILNAPDTMDAFYDAQVRYDFYHRRE